MNTSILKRFAQEARRKLLEQVGAKLNFVLTTDSAELREKTEQLKQLRQELSRTTKEQLIEKVAYTWFNRLMALRFMDSNDYQPLGIRIITPKYGYTTPEILDEAKRGNLPEELKVNRQRIYDLLDNKIPSTNPQNEAYKELLIATCNHLHTTFPFLFEKINDYTELLLPDDLTSDFSILKDVRNGMPLEDCQNVEIIGWLYQFYISEKKDEVFASKSKVKKEDIPAATQLFTPRWIVEYMVQNTLGKLWLQNRPKSNLRKHMQYFIESASLEVEDYLKVNSPEEIKFLDPASGSGHILVYAFDLLTKIYEEEGYNTSEIPQLIIENNLYGFEIDERAAQLSGLALMMKAREFNRRVFHKELKLNILCFHDLSVSKDEIKDLSKSTQIQVSDELMHDFLLLQQANNFGSLIIPHTSTKEIIHVSEKLNQLPTNADIFIKNKTDVLQGALLQLLRLAKKYHCVVTNPPYMSSANMNKELSEFVKFKYPESKADLMACFMESGLQMLHSRGFLGMINQHSWMFLSSYALLRIKLIKNVFVDTLLHLGARTFPEIGGEVVQNTSFVLWNTPSGKEGIYIRLIDFDNSETKRSKTIDAIIDSNCGWKYVANQKVFEEMPSIPIAYWLSPEMTNIFKYKGLDQYLIPKFGMSVGDGQRFIRFGFEISSNKWLKNPMNLEQFCGDNKWASLDKGGEYRRWYGNQYFVVNWQNDGEEIRLHRKSAVRSPQYFLQKHISWTLVSAGTFSARYFDDGYLLDTASNCLYFNNGDAIWTYSLGLLNSKITDSVLSILNPTLNFSCGVVGLIPFKIDSTEEIDNLVIENIGLCKNDWDSKELSWKFMVNELVRIQGQDLEESYELYKQSWQRKFFRLHQNEEELNRIYIKIYGLSTDLTHQVKLENITILQEELDKSLITRINKKLIRSRETDTVLNYGEISLPFKGEVIIRHFISYAVGCMVGRYSLDKEGIIIANQGDSLHVYLHNIGKSKEECAFLPDEDNIIPILEDDWFEDDIVGRFYQFLRVTFGENNFIKNLAFIEEQIGKDIRKYFIKDFYPDHIKRYKKRPIYWMFSSPKGSFNILIYMHRYTPDTVSNILNKYLKEFIGKLNTRKEHLERVKVTGSASDKSKAIKESDNIQKMLVELHEYERDILYPLATERIEIDLDDGVLVNYNKFGKAVKEVNGLNDPSTKKKVKQFDWIDTSQIK